MSNDASLYVRQSRLASDYRSMEKLSGTVITWEALPPFNLAQGVYPAQYRVTYNIRAPTQGGETSGHVLLIDCRGAKYPFAPPDVSFQTSELRHPHVFSDGSHRVCLGGFPVEESLAELCIRIGRFFLYDPNMLDMGSIASQEFLAWYNKNRSRLPLEQALLPSLDIARSGLRVTGRRNT